jgi:hypothetical protein
VALLLVTPPTKSQRPPDPAALAGGGSIGTVRRCVIAETGPSGRGARTVR